MSKSEDFFWTVYCLLVPIGFVLIHVSVPNALIQLLAYPAGLSLAAILGGWLVYRDGYERTGARKPDLEAYHVALAPGVLAPFPIDLGGAALLGGDVILVNTPLLYLTLESTLAAGILVGTVAWGGFYGGVERLLGIGRESTATDAETESEPV